MQTEEKAPSLYIERNPPDAIVSQEGKSPAPPSTSDNAVPLQPGKRPTRQWAAWTREEEESFFTALRQVGKNFEKITCRVQSKNKDQVRHYYYRLVRRMNKLLGPGLCLDAKNSKDTNAAMLRWWSLLEKYSCKASKLHLKPRRFKIFVEALEHQLTKDRKKNVKKRLSQGDNCSFPSASTFPNQNKSSGNDARGVKVVVVDTQNVQKAGNGKGSSMRRNSNMGVTKSSNKGESSPTKSTRQRRRTAAIKRWEKAAMAGVSLVADAAEHVERTAVGNQADQLGGLTVLSVQAVGSSMEKNDPGPSGQEQANLPCSKSVAVESDLQNNMKLKLQLFPIDDGTRKALEMDKHNPHLELTLSTRKKISSILEHLSRKWGSSRVACGELMLFPFDIQRENLMAYQRWTRDSVVTAAEVNAMIGNPPVFRLRYGWIISSEFQSSTSETPITVSRNSHVHESNGMQGPMEQSIPPEEMDKLETHVNQSLSHHQTSEDHSKSLLQLVTTDFSKRKLNVNVDFNDNRLESANSTTRIALKRYGYSDGSTSRKMANVVDRRVRKTPTLSAGEWADSLTNVSVGDLLTEVQGNNIDASGVETPVFRSSQCLEEIPFTCDSFDAAIAAHISSQNKMGFCPSPHSSSIWDAEETCDEFSFRKRALAKKLVPGPATADASVAGEGSASIAGVTTNIQMQEEAMPEDAIEEDPMDECPAEPRETQNSVEDFGSLTDIYWPDSLGPLELDVPSCKYYSEDLILSDSLSGLNRLIASSLDAFQNCPFFALDDKGASPAAAAQGGASFAGKIGKGDNGGVLPLQV